MPFQVITMKNKSFWSRVVTALAGFTMVIIAMAIVFPLHTTNNNNIQVDSTISTATTTEQQIEEV